MLRPADDARRRPDAGADASTFRATNRSRTVMRCWRRSPTATRVIDGYSPGADCAATLACLAALGARCQRAGRTAVVITGRGLRRTAPAGRAARRRQFRDHDAADGRHRWRRIRSARCHRRRVAAAPADAPRSSTRCTRMGARIDSADGRPPLTIDGARAARHLVHDPQVPSAQVKSSSCWPGSCRGTTTWRSRSATRDHTERALAAFGARVVRRHG